MAEAMSGRYAYVKGLADSSQERAKRLHLEYQELDDEANACVNYSERQLLRANAQSRLNDFFYWIGHANAYRGIALQVDFMETVEAEEDEEASCP